MFLSGNVSTAKYIFKVHNKEKINLWMNLKLVVNRGGSRTAATSKVELFVIIVNGLIIVNGSQPLTIITKSSTLDIAAVLDPPLVKIRQWHQWDFSSFSPIPKTDFRSNHLRCSVRKVFLKISQNSLENNCARVFFFFCASVSYVVSANNFIKKDSSTGVFLWILRNFLEHIFW